MFDPACLSLATHFLPQSAPDPLKRALAQRIQDEVENWLHEIIESRYADRSLLKATNSPSCVTSLGGENPAHKMQ